MFPVSCPLEKDQNQGSVIYVRDTINQAWSVYNFPTIFDLRVTDYSHTTLKKFKFRKKKKKSCYKSDKLSMILHQGTLKPVISITAVET